MNNVLKDWLRNQWRFCNHSKYQKYFDLWYNNITNDQLAGFEKQRTADYIQH